MAFLRVASKDDVPEGEVRVFETDDYSLCLANVGGELFATDNICTHDGGELGAGFLWGDQIECPRHGARFDLRTGRVTALPAVMRIKTYPVQVEGDDVKVDIG